MFRQSLCRWKLESRYDSSGSNGFSGFRHLGDLCNGSSWNNRSDFVLQQNHGYQLPCDIIFHRSNARWIVTKYDCGILEQCEYLPRSIWCFWYEWAAWECEFTFAFSNWFSRKSSSGRHLVEFAKLRHAQSCCECCFFKCCIDWCNCRSDLPINFHFWGRHEC